MLFNVICIVVIFAYVSVILLGPAYSCYSPESKEGKRLKIAYIVACVVFFISIITVYVWIWRYGCPSACPA